MASKKPGYINLLSLKHVNIYVSVLRGLCIKHKAPQADCSACCLPVASLEIPDTLSLGPCLTSRVQHKAVKNQDSDWKYSLCVYTQKEEVTSAIKILVSSSP